MATISEFSSTSQYYDILYANKHYKKESEAVKKTIHRHIKSKDISLLDVGCGTAEHLLYLSDFGYKTTGIDRSKEMLIQARKKIKNRNGMVDVRLGDATCFGLKSKFSVIVSLFHVISYLTTNDELIAFFMEVKKHLTKEGICIFDCWYGPGVLADQPVNKTSYYQNNGIQIKRTKQPVLDASTNTVLIKHTLNILSPTGERDTIVELHKMRYFFYPEILFYTNYCGLRILEWKPGTQRTSKKQEWNAEFVLAKK